MYNHISKMADKFLAKITKEASQVETVTVGSKDPILMQYKDQIFKIIQKRYGQELGMQVIPFLGALKFIPDELFHKLLGKIDQVVLTIDRKTDTVLAISGIRKGYDHNRVQLFALKPMEKGMALSQAKAAKRAADQQIELLFSGNNYIELSVDLFEKVRRMYQLYKKSNPEGVDLYIYPAWAAARIMPGRNMRITEDGVIYEKRVHRAGTTAKKILIGSVPTLVGIKGYSSIEEASKEAKHIGKILQGRYGGGIKVKDFNPELWNT